MNPVVFNNSEFQEWVNGLLNAHKVFGVQSKMDKFGFAELKKAGDLRLDYDVTFFPPKYFFQPPCEPLLEFSGPADFKSLVDVERAEQFVLLGVHPYDMAAINQMDKIFSTGNYDRQYMSRRENAVIIGCDVQTPSANVFAGFMNTAVVKTGFDVLLTKIGDKYLAESFTKKGSAFLPGDVGMKKADESDLKLRDRVWEKNRELLRRHELRVPLNEIQSLLDKSYDHPVWEELAKKCFSCGSCNLVCPTCYCFDVRDETKWNLRTGVRSRFWDGCMLKDFATVSGGHNFRKNKEERFRHRYYRKGKYMPDKIGEIACVGCGRCIGACVTKIANPVEVYNRLLEDK